MATDYTIDELIDWDKKIREKVEEFGLSCFPQEFELCDHKEMLGYMAYSGMPAHYPHWSYGKSYEKQKTLYDYGVSGLPYEMVINSDPSIAYLMHQNSLCLQIMTIALVYGHNDFFRNNFTFIHTRPELRVSSVKARAERVRSYVEDPSIGVASVERVLDAAHGLSMQCRRNMAIRKLDTEEVKIRAIEAAEPAADPFYRIHKRDEYVEPELHKVPLEPEEDILLFIRDHNLRLTEWEKDLFTIVHEEAEYFIPQIETKIMNEGWATFWHREILNSLNLPSDLQMEFLVRHNQVVRPSPGEINPYHLGLKIWDDLKRRRDDPTPEEIEKYGQPDENGGDMLFAVREVDRDASFLRRFLTGNLMREMDLFEYEPYGDDLVVRKVSDEENWRAVKETMLKNVGMGPFPVIRIEDADFGGARSLYLKHAHDGRDLQLEAAEKTMGYMHELWGRDVLLETVLNRKKRLLSFGSQGFAMKVLK
ncbi:MAG: SpoVR family protein [Proteobacteria bacterium]|nr:SpoVR family protein [Pseudomonadota bacterium]